MSQRTAGEAIMRRIASHARDLESDLEQLRDLVGKAQNGPPDGEGDGTLNERRWTMLARLRDAMSNFTNQAKVADEDF